MSFFGSASVQPIVWSSNNQPQWLTAHLQNKNNIIAMNTQPGKKLPNELTEEIIQLLQSSRYSSPTDCFNAILLLIEQGANLDYRSNYMKNTLLHCAAAAGQWETLQYLIKNYYSKNDKNNQEGIDIYSVNEEGESILYYAIKNKQLNIAGNLILAGLKQTIALDLNRLLNLTTNYSSSNILHLSASLGLNELIDFILLFDLISIDSLDKGCRNALFYAIEGNQESTIQLLLSRHIPTNRFDYQHETIYHVLARYNHLSLLKLIIQKSVDFHLLTAVNNEQQTAAQLAKQCGFHEFADYIDKTLLNNRRLTKHFYRYKSQFSTFIGYYVLFWLNLWIIHHWICIRPYCDLLGISIELHIAMYTAIFTAIASWIATHFANPGRILNEFQMNQLEKQTNNGKNDKNSRKSAEIVPLLDIHTVDNNNIPASHIERMLQTNYTQEIIRKLTFNPVQAATITTTTPNNTSNSNSDTHPSVQLCLTCRLIRPYRSKHCAWCNHCITLYDHHCPFVDQCIGSQNFLQFLIFIYSTSAIALMYTYTSFCYIFSEYFQWDFFTILSTFHLIPMGTFVLVLSFTQFRLISQGLTTNEFSNRNRDRYSYVKRKEFAGSWIQNWNFFCCKARKTKY